MMWLKLYIYKVRLWVAPSSWIGREEVLLSWIRCGSTANLDWKRSWKRRSAAELDQMWKHCRFELEEKKRRQFEVVGA